MERSSRKRPHESESSSGISIFEKKILKYMHEKYPPPHKTLTIAKDLGMKTKSDVNKTLYKLQNKGFIRKVVESPPAWALSEHEQTSDTTIVTTAEPTSLSSASYVHSFAPGVFSTLPQEPQTSYLEASSSSATETQTGNATLVLPEGKNAISVLNEYAQRERLTIEYKESMSGPDHMKRFEMVVELGGKCFPGAVASTKKEARLKAAAAALTRLYQKSDIQPHSTTNCPIYSASQPEPTVHQKVASLVNEKYNELVQQLPDTIVGRKIIAGIVMSRTLKSDEKTFEVVSIGSGNRCVAGDKLSLQGTTVNDCHAEVIARRSLVRYLYKKLLKRNDAFNPAEDNIFKLSEDRLAVIPEVEFHLYISTAPCGDSAIFAPSDAATDDPMRDLHDSSHHPVFENRKQGLLRTKVENGEGCIPIEEDAAIPTWDGLLRGARLRTMSCSDKLAKWNFLGLQGALLSHFLKPVHLSTLTLGMLYNHGHLTRAVCCRVQKFMEAVDEGILPPTSYRVHHPVVSGQNQSRETGKLVRTREFSINWSLGDSQVEVLDGTEGKCEPRFGSNGPSRLCKARLFMEYKELCAKTIALGMADDSYYNNKLAATEYQVAKALFQDAFEKCGFGKWMPKPREEKDF